MVIIGLCFSLNAVPEYFKEKQIFLNEYKKSVERTILYKKIIFRNLNGF